MAFKGSIAHRGLLIILVIASYAGTRSHAQPVDTALTAFSVIADFEEARAVSVDPAGILYVVDQGRSIIHQLNSEGELIRKLGGPGVSEGQFDEPQDIDPTNGLILVVADAGNGRIQRFSREFLFLESLRIGTDSRYSVNTFPDQPRYRQNEGRGSFGDGRPIAVKTTSSNEMYAIDASRNVVVKWDQDRNIAQIVGDYHQGEGALIEPVAIEVGTDGSLFVVDRMRDAVLVYDAFGGYVRSMAVGLCREARAIERAGNFMFIVLPDKLLLFQERGRLEFVAGLDIPERIEDVLYHKGFLYVLSTTSLYKRPFSFTFN